jgi:radical SAM protein with 4Fe4S-binding SPASM domain
MTDEATRRALLEAPRPRRELPILAPEKKRLPLADASRDIDRRIRPIYAVWEITLACDLACRHCGSRAGRARGDELDTRECLDLVDQLADLGVMEVILIGGEAYLRDDWLTVIAHIRKRGMQALMTTGGRALTKERARAAADAGLLSASVSIDGGEETHDRLRALPGSFRAALESLENLREAGIKVSANTQINRLSMGELHHVLDLIAARGVHSWQIQLTVGMGRAADEPEVLLQPYDLLELFPILGEIADRCSAQRIKLWPGNNIGYFGPIETKLHGTMPQGHMASCGAGWSGMGIESDGTIKGCPSLSTATWSGGNVRDERLEAIWERAPKLRYTRDRTVDDLWGYCRTCYYAEICMAGCTWTSESILGRPGNNPMCHHRALEHARVGKRERIVPSAAAPGVPFDHARFELVLEDLPAQTSSRGTGGAP